MGAVYDVKITLSIKDKQAFMDKAIEYINTHNNKDIIFNLEKYDPLDSVENIMKVMITNRQFSHTDNTYESHFDATYGWDSVILNFINAVKQTLTSYYVDMWSDNDHIREGE